VLADVEQQYLQLTLDALSLPPDANKSKQRQRQLQEAPAGGRS
jgi:hypothetical protein